MRIPTTGAAIISCLTDLTRGARPAAGAARSAIDKTVPTAGMRVTTVMRMSARITSPIRCGLRPLVRYAAWSKAQAMRSLPHTMRTRRVRRAQQGQEGEEGKEECRARRPHIPGADGEHRAREEGLDLQGQGREPFREEIAESESE